MAALTESCGRPDPSFGAVPIGSGCAGSTSNRIDHLAIDAVSWRILLEDLSSLCSDPQGQVKLRPERFL